MPSAPLDDGPIHDTSGFSCSWTSTGVASAHVQAAGDVDLATAPRLAQVLRQSVEAATLVLLDLRDVTFMDCSGLHVLVDVTAEARRHGRSLVCVQLREPVEALLERTGTGALLDVLDPIDVGRRPGASPGRPNANPVNARIVASRVMAVADRRLWLHTDDGHVERVWVPEVKGELASPQRPIKLFLDADGAVNGWWDPISDVAINQRHLDAVSSPPTGWPMVCQGRCGLTWEAPAAAQLEEHDEHCLTCAGPLARG